MQAVFRFLAVAYVAYLALAVLVLMPALNFFPAWYVKEALNRELHSEIILFNPFTLALEVRRAALPEHSGEAFLALDNATVNLSLESLWQRGWVFDEISVAGLYAHVRQLDSEHFNFSDMLPPGEPEQAAPEQESGGIPGLTVHKLALLSERLSFTNESRDEPYSTHLDGMDIEVNDLSTVLEEGKPYRLDVRGEAGGTLHWEGVVSIPGAYSEGRLVLSNISLHALWRFAKPWLNLELRDGRLGVEADYRVDWAQALRYQLDRGKLSLTGIDIQPLDPATLPDTSLTLGQLAVDDISVDGTAQNLAVSGMSIEGLAVNGWMEGERISLAELFAVELPEEDEPPAPSDSEDQSGWRASLKTLKLEQSRINWRSPFTDPPQLAVTPLQASAENIHWPLGGDTAFGLKLGVNDQVNLEVDGSLDLGTGDGDIGFDLQGLPIPWANPNLPAALNAAFTDGFVQVDGNLALAAFAPQRVASNGAITQLSGQLRDTEESLTSLKRMRWEELEVKPPERSVSLARLTIDQYSGRLHIKKDGSINAQNVWRQEVGEQAAELAEDLSLDEPWKVDLPSIKVTDSRIDFMDESLPIVFRTIIGGLSGEVTGMSTRPGSSASVDMRGSVDGYAPVLLSGTAAPFTEPPALDLDLGFDGVDLALLTPYSGTYAGYAIDRGLLTLDLQYTLDNARLEGHNSIRIEQMKLGDKVASDKAVDLPLGLAIALLTDSNGVIDMQVPVSGNVDDPKFHIGSIITKTLINLITKAVTAPFSLLANLVGSEEDLQRVVFAAGSAQLDDQAGQKLRQLGSAMTQRPGLNLVISGRLQPAADRTGLQEAALHQQLLDAGLDPSELAQRGPAWEKAVAKRYGALGASAQEQDAPEPTPLQQYEQVARQIDIPDDALQELAEERAVAVKTFLVKDLSLGPDRAVIEQASARDAANTFSGVELGVSG